MLFVHAIVFYLLIFHTKSWASAVRVGYLLNQVLLLLFQGTSGTHFSGMQFRNTLCVKINIFITQPILGPNACSRCVDVFSLTRIHITSISGNNVWWTSVCTNRRPYVICK